MIKILCAVDFPNGRTYIGRFFRQGDDIFLRECIIAPTENFIEKDPAEKGKPRSIQAHYFDREKARRTYKESSQREEEVRIVGSRVVHWLDKT